MINKQIQQMKAQNLPEMAKRGVSFDSLDGIECPCTDIQRKNCDITGYYPAFCKPVQRKIDIILSKKET